jgi:Crp-like helix-turn-helix domain
MTIALLNLEQRVFNQQSLIPPQLNLLWRIDHGIVRTVTWNEIGTKSTLGYWGAQDVVVECLTSVKVTAVPTSLWHHLLEPVVLHGQQVEQLLSIVHRDRIQLRLLELLTWLAQKFGRPIEQVTLIDLPLTHQQLAETISSTRVTVTRLLEQLEQAGLIRRIRRSIVLLSDRALAA